MGTLPSAHRRTIRIGYDSLITAGRRRDGWRASVAPCRTNPQRAHLHPYPDLWHYVPRDLWPSLV